MKNKIHFISKFFNSSFPCFDITPRQINVISTSFLYLVFELRNVSKQSNYILSLLRAQYFSYVSLIYTSLQGIVCIHIIIFIKYYIVSLFRRDHICPHDKHHQDCFTILEIKIKIYLLKVSFKHFHVCNGFQY